MKEIFFHLFAALTLVPAIFAAASRNPVNAAMNMLISFVGLAALFVLLESYLLAVLQVLVYAGAIVVLFLFIIMLIDAEKAPPPKLFSYVASVLALALLVLGSWYLVFEASVGPFPSLAVDSPSALARNFGPPLFTQYMLPFQITGFMLLIAMVGVVVISKRKKNREGDAQS